MKPTFILRTRAKRDLVEQAHYLDATATPDVSDRYLEAVTAAFASLVAHDQLGKRVHSTRKNLRGLRQFSVAAPFGKYVVFYIPTTKGIDVARILHGSRDIDSILALG